MAEYKNVLPGLYISRRLFDLMEKVDPVKYNGTNRAAAIGKFNDIIQGRAGMSIDVMIQTIQEKIEPHYPSEAAQLCEQITNFNQQKQQIYNIYDKVGSDDYTYEIFDTDAERPLKIITQRIYDSAVKNGFPPDFFRESYFGGVQFYCLPDHADFQYSSLRSCRFTACRIQSAFFDRASLYDTAFHTVIMRSTTFFTSSLAHTHFRDSTLLLTDFSFASLKSCDTIDCDMERVNYLNATLDGCSFGRIKASDIKQLDTATITMGGATDAECKRNRDAIYRALRVKSPPTKRRKPNEHTK